MTRPLPAVAFLAFLAVGVSAYANDPVKFETVHIVALVVAAVILVGEVVFVKTGRDIWR